MAISTLKSLLNAGIVPSTGAAVYTAPATVARVAINMAIAHNYSAGPETLTVQVLQSGESAAAQYRRYYLLPIAAGETVYLNALIAQGINRGGVVWAEASAATSIAITLNGTEFPA